MATPPSLEPLALEIRAELGHAAQDIWRDRARGVPRWVHDAITPASVLRVLELARDTTVELGVPAVFLSQTSPAELATYWTIVFRNMYDQELPRAPVSIAKVELAVARRIASAVFSMHTQSARYRNFLRFGPPPGVQQFPQFSASERTKTLAVPWEWRRTAAQPERAMQYQSCTLARARRRQSLRSQQCAPSDVLNPGLFN